MPYPLVLIKAVETLKVEVLSCERTGLPLMIFEGVYFYVPKYLSEIKHLDITA